jgi:hypothetical protein
MDAARADALLCAQVEHLRSDERLRELAALAAEMTPEERLAQAWAMSASGAAARELLAEDERARVDALREPLGPGAEQVLARLAGLSSPGAARGPGVR